MSAEGYENPGPATSAAPIPPELFPDNQVEEISPTQGALTGDGGAASVAGGTNAGAADDPDGGDDDGDNGGSGNGGRGRRKRS